jgi:hypothetical protein
MEPDAQVRATTSLLNYQLHPAAMQDNMVMITTALLSLSDTVFTLKAFSGAANKDDKAKKWSQTFERYISLKRITGEDKLDLFKLILTDQAADWPNSLPKDVQQSFEELIAAFKKRYELTRVDRWKRCLDIWKLRRTAIKRKIPLYSMPAVLK